MTEKEFFPDVLYMRGVTWDDSGCVQFEARRSAEDHADPVRVKKVGVYRLEKLVNVGANVIVTEVYVPKMENADIAIIPEKGE
jgi:hypothetical protein